MEKNKIQRYHMTRCNDKRSIVRALNTFSEQYDFIYCAKQEINLAIEPMELNYGNDKKDFAFGLVGGNLNEKEQAKLLDRIVHEKSIIYSNDEAKMDLVNTKLILEAIDNLISINRKSHIKKALKEVVESRNMNGINHFFRKETIAINSISLALNTGEEEEYSDAFIKRLFSQIKNRVKFRRSGIYATNDSGSKVLSQKLINTIPTSHIEIIQKQFDFLLENIDTLSMETRDDVMEAREVYERDRLHPGFDPSLTDFEDNSSLFHPINEGDDEPDLKDSARYSNMPLPLLYRVRDGLYNEEEWNAYNEYEDYEKDITEIAEVIDELIPYIDKKNELERDIYMVFDNDEVEEFEIYQKNKVSLNEKQRKKERDNLIKTLYQSNTAKNLYQKAFLFQNYFLCEDAVNLFQEHALVLGQYGFVFSKEEFLQAYETQDKIFSCYKCESLPQYKIKFDEVGVNRSLYKWFGEYDMVMSYWFDATMYPFYQDALPKNWFEKYTSNEEIIDDEELIRLGYYEEPSHLDEEKEDESTNKSPKQYPEIPF